MTRDNPVGTAPWGPPPYNPADMDNAILQQIGPAASAIVELEHEIIQAIVSGLAEAEASLQAIDDSITQRVATHFLPAYHALSTVGRDLQNEIRTHMANSAMMLSAVQGEPVHLSEVMASPSVPAPIPANPAHVPPGKTPAILPPNGPGPQTPLIRPPQRIPNPPPNYPAPPANLPTSVPNAPGLPGGGWGAQSTTSLVASSNPAQGGAGGATDSTTTTTRSDSSATSSAATPQIMAASSGTGSAGLSINPEAAFGGGGGGTLTDFINNPPAGWKVCSPMPAFPEGGAGGPQDPAQCMGIGDPTLQALCMQGLHYWCVDSPSGGSPTPTTPSPTTPSPTTPSPTTPSPTTPSPTGTGGGGGNGGGGNGGGGNGGTPTPTTPTDPTVKPDCPDGFYAVFDPKYGWSCQPVPPLTTTPDPTPTTPDPTPTTPGGGGLPTPANCGATRPNPCFVAASSIDSANPHFMHDFGHLDDVQKAGANVKADQQIQGNPQGLAINLVDRADVLDNCTVPYQITLVDPNTDVGTFMLNIVDLDDVYNQATKRTLRSEGLWRIAIVGPLLVLIGLLRQLFMIWQAWIIGMFSATSPLLAKIASNEIIYRILNVLCFGALRKHGRIITYVNDLQYPVGLPTPAEAGVAWLANTIDDCTFQTYVQSGDNRFLPYKQVVTAGKMKFTGLELKTLDKRGGITRGTLATRMRELGSLHPEDLGELETLYLQVPGPGSLIRFMVRDTFNADTVKQFHMDDNFGANYQGKIKDWAFQQGVSDEIMQHEWRAHWSIPAPTQLYEILHRLRHDPAYSAAHDVVGDVREALIQQDILPYWIEALMAISYHPLNRTDLNRAYERGWVDDDAYVQGMYNNGYSDDDAQTLLKFAKSERLLAVKNSDFGARYIHGSISADQAVELAHTEGFDPALDDTLLSILDPLRSLELQRRQLEGLIHQYKRCYISQQELTDTANQLFIPAPVVEWNLSWAGEDTTCGTKREAVASLCTALDQGIITPSEYVDRMKLLKYDEHAINTYLTLCQNKSRAAQAKKLAADQKAADKAEKQAEQEAEKQAKQAQAQANRISKQLATMERKRQARNKALETAANNLGHNLTDAPDPPSVYVQGLYHTLMDQYQLSQDEAASIISMASTKATGMDSAAFTSWVGDLAQTSLKEPWLGYFPEPTQSNGAV